MNVLIIGVVMIHSVDMPDGGVAVEKQELDALVKAFDHVGFMSSN